jgi:hypothetical protein
MLQPFLADDEKREQRKMKSIKEKLAQFTQSGDGPSPLEYSVIVVLLVAASLTVISSSRQISHPYVSRLPMTSTR